MANKLTKKENFMRVVEVLENKGLTDLVEVMKHEIELIEKKSANKTQTKTQKENEVLVEKVYEALIAIARPVAVDELRGASDEMSVFSNQKLSALLKKLVDAGRVIKTVDKKKSYFSVAE